MTRQKLAHWAIERWYVGGLLFPVMLAAILLGLFAALGSWWLWPIVAVLAVPATLIVSTPRDDDRLPDNAAWHLR